MNKVQDIVAQLDLEAIRAQFPILEEQVNNAPLVYLDNAATSQKPLSVINAIERYYRESNSNVHRGVHRLSQQATAEFEAGREHLRRFINAKLAHEVIFTSGTTDSINLVAQTLGRKILGEGDEVLISTLEHHSNIVPWQMVCEERGAKLKVIPILDNGDLDMDAFYSLLNERTKILSVAHVSNALGTTNPVKGMIDAAHAIGAKVLLDGAQAVPHSKVDVQALDVDLYSFSAHKMYGPTGMGVLYGKDELLNEMPPYQGGGEMIETVTFEKTTYNSLPHKFEAGTPNIAGGIAFGAAVEFMESIGAENIAAHEAELLTLATDGLKRIDGLNIIGEAKEKAAVVSFNVEGLHHYDIGTLLDQMGIAVRTGHHCTQPLMARYGITGTVRASFAVYNTVAEVQKLIAGVEQAVKMLR